MIINFLITIQVSNGRNEINYSGFILDEKEITIWDKTIIKYYYRLYRKLKTFVKSEGYIPRENNLCEFI